MHKIRAFHNGCWAGLAFLGLGGSIGCRSDRVGSPAASSTVSSAKIYWQLTLNHHAITLALTAPYDTITLVATPRMVTGAPIADTGMTTYSVSDPTTVRLSPTGVLTALGPATGVTIIAQRTIGGDNGVTLADTALVNVNDVSPIPVARNFSVQMVCTDFQDPPKPQASAPIGVVGGFGCYTYPQVTVLDAAGNSIPNVALSVSSGDARIIGFMQHLFVENSYGFPEIAAFSLEGTVEVTITANVYGQEKAATTNFTVTAPQYSVVGVFPVTQKGKNIPIGLFSPPDDTIAVGGTVVWENFFTNQVGSQLVDVVFDMPAAAQAADSILVDSINFGNDDINRVVLKDEGAGDIAGFTPETESRFDSFWNQTIVYAIVHARRFQTAGTYSYHSDLYHTTGVIHVLR